MTSTTTACPVTNLPTCRVFARDAEGNDVLRRHGIDLDNPHAPTFALTRFAGRRALFARMDRASEAARRRVERRQRRECVVIVATYTGREGLRVTFHESPAFAVSHGIEGEHFGPAAVAEDPAGRAVDAEHRAALFTYAATSIDLARAAADYRPADQGWTFSMAADGHDQAAARMRADFAVARGEAEALRAACLFA